ncbi:MAG: PhoX family phosphatase [Bryobacteraceae bacterium]|nr:PhoX family phosphatase [Bryobacteraceae bacterium]MDW8378238.1 PhoX family phosphatase [Bryobacterales bacterium]
MSQSFETILRKRFGRRALFGGTARMIPLAAFAAGMQQRGSAADSPEAVPASPEEPKVAERDAARDSRLQFQPIAGTTRDAVVVASGYRSDLLIAWGDPLFNDSPPFDPSRQTGRSQSLQFGYNVDWMGFFPLPAYEVKNSSHGLIVVNHEYTNPELMFKNWGGFENQTKDQTEVELEAHGLSVIEVMRDRSGRWRYIQGSRFNRRITATTFCRLTGPAAGSRWMQTSADLSGDTVMGTLNNCAGGETPWGTAISGEENFHQYFSNVNGLPTGPVRTLHSRYGIPGGNGSYPWARHFRRFDVAQEPNEPFRHGWMVEFDPYDPTSMPKKRTALGRFRHEGCTFQIARNGRVVGYMGDDERFQYMYKYVSRGVFNPFDRAANDKLLDEGTLYVAKLNEDGTGEWLALVQGNGPLTAANGYPTQAEVLIDTRGAATLLGATPMDRPEDMEANPVTGKVYVALTNNTARTDRQVNKSNPRANNRFGHILEITEDDGDHTSTKFTWEIFMLCGDGKVASHGAFFAGYDPTKVSAIANPDNIIFDNKGNLWISTDGQPSSLRINDGVYAVATEGPERGNVKQLLSVAVGAEAASLVLTPDNTALFVSVQHPGEGGKWTDNPSEAISNFPDSKQPARPALVVVTKTSGSPIIGT